MSNEDRIKKLKRYTKDQLIEDLLGLENALETAYEFAREREQQAAKNEEVLEEDQRE